MSGDTDARPPAESSGERDALEALAAMEAAPFGPRFFLGQLGAFVRDRCPDPEERLPAVYVHVIGGEVLDVCHVIGLTRRWVALAVYEQASRAMRTELVPYAGILRIAICPGHGEGPHIGFQQHAPPVVHDSAEEALERAALPGSQARTDRSSHEERGEPR